MTINKNYLITFFIALLAILTGKEILIYNEEILIVFTFSAFVIFAYINLGDGISNDLNERALKIQKEFEEYYNVREEILRTLITYHQKQLSLSEEIVAISEFSKNHIEYIIAKQEQSLNNTILTQVKNKLKTIASEEARIIHDIQRKILADLNSDFNKDFAFVSNAPANAELQTRALDDAIDGLEKIANEAN